MHDIHSPTVRRPEDNSHGPSRKRLPEGLAGRGAQELDKRAVSFLRESLTSETLLLFFAENAVGAPLDCLAGSILDAVGGVGVLAERFRNVADAVGEVAFAGIHEDIAVWNDLTVSDSWEAGQTALLLQLLAVVGKSALLLLALRWWRRRLCVSYPCLYR